MAIEDPQIAALLARWNDLFGTTPVTVRAIVSLALDGDPDLLKIMTTLTPDLADNPVPRVFSRWLLRHENFPLADPESNAHRFIRQRTTVDGALWVLKPVTEPALATA